MNAFDVNNFDLSQKGGTFLLEASAGTGKTYNIAILALRFILERNVDIQNILIVTFTNAAVDELKIRIKKFLNEAYVYINDKNRYVETEGIKEIIDNLKEKENIKERIRNAILNFDEASIFTIHSFCQRMLKEFPLESGLLFDFELLPDSEDLLQKSVIEYWREKVNRENGWLSKISEDKNFIELIKGSVRNYLAGKQLYPPENNSDSDIIRMLHEANREVVKKLDKIKEDYGVLTFDDLINKLYNFTVIDGNEELIRKIAQKYEVVFVDEFQDTDKKQAEIFENIFEKNNKFVFYIGDPKQSIYSFRNADIYAYLDVKNRILQQEGGAK